VDHIFILKGKGYALTGTILNGSMTKNGMIAPISDPKKLFKIKSIQSFKQDIDKAVTGDRVGILVQGDNVDSLKEKERHVYINPVDKTFKVKSMLCVMSRVPYFKLTLISDS